MDRTSAAFALNAQLWASALGGRQHWSGQATDDLARRTMPKNPARAIRESLTGGGACCGERNMLSSREAAMSESRKQSELEFVVPRTVRVHFRGQIDLEESRRIQDFIEAQVKDQPYFLYKAIILDLEGATPDGRGHAADRLKELPQRAIAIIGGSFAQRVLVNLVLKASIMLDRSAKKNVGSTFKTEAEADVWLAAYAAARDAEADK